MKLTHSMTFLLLVAACLAISCTAFGLDAQSLLTNPSFEEDGGWNVEGDGGPSTLAEYGPIPDGEKVMHFTGKVWQETHAELVPGQEWRLSFRAGSYGTSRLFVEWRGCKEDDGTPGELLSSTAIAVPSGQIWAFREDVPPADRQMMNCQSTFIVPENASGRLVLLIATKEGYAGIDDLRLVCAKPSVIAVDGAPRQAAAGRFGEGAWLGSEDFGIYWQGAAPKALALRGDDGRSLLREWTGGVFWRLTYDGKEGFSNLDAGTPEIASEGNGWLLKWEHEGIGVDVTVRPRADRAMELGFAIRNGSERTVQDFHLPGGWPEPIHSKAEWIVPAWTGTGIPMENMEPVTILYPGQMDSQWFGFQDPNGFSWMVHTEDTIPCTKFLSLDNTSDDSNLFDWWHDLYLAAGKTYACQYPTVLTAFPHGDWNEMAKTYRAWAKTAPWFLPVEEKLARRPQIARLRNGWSWLTGMGPVEEWGGRICETTYPQALECMREYRRRLRLNPMFWYSGWYGPFDSMYPEFFPVAPEMGGSFEEFAETSWREGHFVTLHLNAGEFNEAANVFDEAKMARWRGRFYANKYGDSARNYVVSYPCVLPIMLDYTNHLANELHMNIYYDVMGHVYAHDDNPNAGYDPDTIGRCNWSVAKNAAWKALRELAPNTYFQTEGCAECAIPYVDAPSGGDSPWVMTAGRHPLPLWQLVYSDTGFYLPLYDGIGQYNCSAGFTLNPLFAGITQYPQKLWTTLEPFWLYIVRRQHVLGMQSGKELLRYEIDGEFRRSFWQDATVLALPNDHAACRATMELPDHTIITLDGFGVSPEFAKRGGGSAAVINGRGLTVDAVGSVFTRGRLLWRAPDARLSVALCDRSITVYNGTPDAISGKCLVGLPAFAGCTRLLQWDFSEAKWSEGPKLLDEGDVCGFELTLPPNSIAEFVAE